MQELAALLSEIRNCRECEAYLPHGVRPIVQMHSDARILIVGQAPGRRVHETGKPFDDPSGDRLRQWMGIDRDTFYNPEQIAILPMGFCYPGKGKSGDLPPRLECAPKWRGRSLEQLPDIQLTLLVGTYAMAWHLQSSRAENLTDTVKNWKSYWPKIAALPHPSPRNNIWLAKNPWFEAELVPQLRSKVSEILEAG
jgi:uracil-DNA glycosylase